eukprot:8103653-Karenia_brevis.AAC.1
MGEVAEAAASTTTSSATSEESKSIVMTEHWLRLRKLYFVTKTAVRKKMKKLLDNPPRDVERNAMSSRRLKKAARSALRQVVHRIRE